MSKKGSVTVKLEYPVEYEGYVVSELTFRRMIGRDALAIEAEKNQLRQTWVLYGLLSDRPPEFFELIDNDDMDTIEEKTTPLMGKKAAAHAEKLKQMQEAALQKMTDPTVFMPQPVAASPGETGS
ncbi:MAG: phage tail assembly protein [Pseudomonadota bacterium]